MGPRSTPWPSRSAVPRGPPRGRDEVSTGISGAGGRAPRPVARRAGSDRRRGQRRRPHLGRPRPRHGAGGGAARRPTDARRSLSDSPATRPPSRRGESVGGRAASVRRTPARDAASARRGRPAHHHPRATERTRLVVRAAGAGHAPPEWEPCSVLWSTDGSRSSSPVAPGRARHAPGCPARVHRPGGTAPRRRGRPRADGGPPAPRAARGQTANVEGAGEVTLTTLVRSSAADASRSVSSWERSAAPRCESSWRLSTPDTRVGAAPCMPTPGGRRGEIRGAGALWQGLTPEAVRAQLSAAIDVVVHVTRDQGLRRLASVAVLFRRDGDPCIVPALEWEGPRHAPRCAAGWPALAARLGLATDLTAAARRAYASWTTGRR